MTEKKRTAPTKKADAVKKPAAKKAAVTSTAPKSDAKQGMTFEEIKVALAETLIGQVIDVMESGDFREINDHPLGNGFEAIGVANAFEKACVTVRARLLNEIKALQRIESEEAAIKAIFDMLSGDQEVANKLYASAKKAEENSEAIETLDEQLRKSFERRFKENGDVSVFNGHVVGLRRKLDPSIFREFDDILRSSPGVEEKRGSRLFHRGFQRGR